MAVTDLAAALGVVATAGVEAVVVAGAAGLAIATTEIGVLPQSPRAQRLL
ncbi:RNA-binding protein Y14 [Fusarium fujikuroi]|nr:RNA-binding protein Y14 [Fusarium fujikuroi]